LNGLGFQSLPLGFIEIEFLNNLGTNGDLLDGLKQSILMKIFRSYDAKLVSEIGSLLSITSLSGKEGWLEEYGKVLEGKGFLVATFKEWLRVSSSPIFSTITIGCF